MEVRQLLVRLARLNLLSRGLRREIVRWERCDDPLLYLERKALLAALLQTWGGVEGARVALAKACRRLRGE
jgi:hypothetical protein